jgi:predicted transcriptional regulator
MLTTRARPIFYEPSKNNSGTWSIANRQLNGVLQSFVSDLDIANEVLRAVHELPARSVKALAERLGRDYKRVHEDVETLTASGLLHRENGNVSAPYDAITAEMRL